jgi:plastocyanin
MIRVLSLTGLVCVALAVAACSESADAPGESTATSPPASIDGPQEQPEPAQPLDSEVTEPSGGAVEITIEGNRFAPNNIEVPVGEDVAIRVSNADNSTHNLRIAGIDGRFETEDDAVTEPPQLEEGALGEVNFAPGIAGGYTFRCDFHPGAMGGRITASE